MIPKTLDQAIIELLHNSLISIDTQFRQSEENVVAYHHSLGRTLRNKWLLWVPDSTLSKHFNELGIHHADDMSSIILMTLHRILNKKPVKLKEQIEHHQEYWRRYNEKL